MGIDARAISSALPKHWFPGKSLSANRKTLEKTAQSWADARDLGPLFQLISLSETSLEIGVVPICDPIRFNFQDNRLAVSLRSSNAGPGYHAAVIDMLDKIAQSLSVTWHRVASNGEMLDETGFATGRDFAALQARMAVFLGQLCKTIAFDADDDSDHLRKVTFCLPQGLGLLPGKVACPLGFAPLKWVSEVQTMEDEDVLDTAAGFFRWWQYGLTQATWAQLLRAQLWQNAEWRPVRSESDRLVLKQIRHSYARATSGGIGLSEDIEQAYVQYLACQSDEGPPTEEGIGYRKYPVWMQLYQSWAISLPGYLAIADGTVDLVFEHQSLWLGVSSFAVTEDDKASSQFIWPERFNGPLIQISPQLFFRKSDRQYTDGSSAQGAMICSTRADGHKLLLLTLASHLDSPFDQFDRWIKAVYCPDLPADTKSQPSNYH